MARHAGRRARAAGVVAAPRGALSLADASRRPGLARSAHTRDTPAMDANPELEVAASLAPVAGPAPGAIPPAQSRLSAFPPIAGYAFLSDCETVALIAP